MFEFLEIDSWVVYFGYLLLVCGCLCLVARVGFVGVVCCLLCLCLLLMVVVLRCFICTYVGYLVECACLWLDAV